MIMAARRLVMVAVLVSMVSACNGSGGGGSGLPSTIDVRDIEGRYGTRLEGGSNLGVSVSGAQDVNEDGWGDVLIGVPGGEVLLELGRSHAVHLTSGAILRGLGRSVSDAGDVNGDGIGDILLGAPNSDVVVPNAGMAVVVFGGRWLDDHDVIDLDTLDTTRAVRLVGSEEDAFAGTSVSRAGDLNGDGFADVLLGSSRYRSEQPGSADAYLVFGSAHLGQDGEVDLASLDGVTGVRFTGVDGIECRAEVSAAGDVNGDGRDDLIVGDWSTDRAYVVLGASSLGTDGVVDLRTLTIGQALIVTGSGGADHAGESVAGAGDVNGDGFVDVLVGVPRADVHGLTDAGAIAVVFGDVQWISLFLGLDELNGVNGTRLEGGELSDRAGNRVAAAGDVDADGFADLLVCVPGGSASYLVYGGPALAARDGVELGALIARQQAVRFDGYHEPHYGDLPSYTEERPSRYVAGVGDLDRDGRDDLAVSATGTYWFDYDETKFGVVYVISGRKR